MARILLGPDVIDKRGRQANQVYSTWKSGMAYVRNIATVIRNPRSALQQARRTLMALLGRAWQTLTKEQQNQWNSVALTNYRGGATMGGQGGIKNLIKGSGEKITGSNAFMQANQLARMVGGTAIIAEPLVHTPAPNAPPDVTVTDGTDKITVAWGDIEGVMPSQFVRVYIADHQNRFHRQFIDFAPGSAKTMNINQVRGVNGDMLPMSFINGDEVIVQLDTVDQATGWASPASQTVQHVIDLVPAP